jgi:Lrp/AsnC family transcriptional regulator
MQDHLDTLDIRILAELQDDCTLSTGELASRIGLSQAPCWRRLNRLRSEGYIRREVALVDRCKVGLGIQVFAHVKLSSHGRTNVSEFIEATKSRSEILECHIVLGAVDVLLRVVVEDMNTYERFFYDYLSRLPGVQEVNSMVSLTEGTSTTSLPIKGTLQQRIGMEGPQGI